MNQKVFLQICAILALTWNFTVLVCAYEAPKAKIEIFYPKGFQVSIPDEEGITLFAFHGKLNEEMDGLEAGTWARDIVTPKNGRWTFRDRITQLKIGDTLYFWTYVIYKGLGYREDDGVFVVKEYTASTDPIRGPVIVETSTTPTFVRSTSEASCPSSKSIVNGMPIRCAGQIVFEDEFSGSQLDPNKWKVERRFADEPDYEFVWYLDDTPEVLSVTNSMVIIKPIASSQKFEHPFRHGHNLGPSCTGKLETSNCVRQGGKAADVPPFISAQFSTKERFTFKYGRIEIRAKLPHAPWVFPEIWLQPVGTTYGVNNYQSGQMRIAFSRSNGNSIDLFGGVILNKNEPLRSAKMCKMASSQNADWGNGFHVYKLIWTEDLIAVAVDNEEYCRINPTSDLDALYNTKVNGVSLPNKDQFSGTSSRLAPFDQEFYITLGYGIGGHSDFNDTDNWQEVKPWRNTEPNAMKRLWKKKKQNMQQWLANGDFKIDYVKVFTI